ncbi:MAG: FlgD immunoglobulin-like domain containing protein [Verrucomicrobiota bacterium]
MRWGFLLLFAATNLVAQTNLPVNLPAGHAIFSAVVDNADGRRVSNLFAMQPVTNTIAWDGKDEAGQPVPSGTYTVRGISLPALKTTYDYSWYNPGNPPWEGYPGSGWGGDHTGPTGVAVIPEKAGKPWRVVITGEIAEAGDAVFALDKNFKKVFGFKRAGGGAHAVAVDNTGLVYLVLYWHKSLLRLDPATGRSVPFQRPAGTVAEIQLESTAHSLAVSDTRIAVVTIGSVPDKLPPKLLILDKQAGRINLELPLDVLQDVAFDRHGTLYLSRGTNGLALVDLAGKIAPVAVPGLVNAGAFCFDQENNLVIHDRGPDWQIKVFSPERKLLRTIGKQGGQGRLLAWDSNILQAVSSVAVDETGNVWLTESGPHLRRTAVFGRDGNVQREFIGCTQYGAYECQLHEQDPTRAMAYSVEYAVNPAAVSDYRPVRLLSSGLKLGSPFTLDKYARGMRSLIFRAQGHEYIMQYQPFASVLYVERNGDYRPCGAVFDPKWWAIDDVRRASPGFREDDPTWTVRLWSDWNEDELIQEEELQIVPEFDKAGAAWLRPFGSNYPLGDDLALYINARTIVPSRIAAGGTPIYTVTNAVKFADALDTSYSAFQRAGRHLFGLQFGTQPFYGRHVFADLTGRMIGYFDFKRIGLQGSQSAPMPLPGETAGETLVAGVADIGGDLGAVIAHHGNMGQAFLFSEDGIFLSSLFKDVRDNPAGYGDKVVKGADWTNVTMTQEAFGGWFGKQSDGKVRYLFGRNAALVVQIHGLEDAKRFTAGIVEIK